MARRWYENRVFRLLVTLFLANAVVVVGELLLVFGLLALSMSRRGPPALWMELIPTTVTFGSFAGQLLMLSLVGALVEKARWSAWLAILPFAMVLAVGFVAFQVGPALFNVARTHNVDELRVLSVMIVVGSSLPIILCYGGVLLASVLLWPLKVLAGWRAAWHDDPIVSIRSAPISHLMLWIGLWAALFLLATSLAERFGEDGIFVALVGSALILFTGLPVAILLSGQEWTWLRWSVTVAYILLLSWGESELIYWLLKPAGFTTVSRVLMVVLGFNAPLAAVIAMNCLMLRGVGLRLNMPLRWWRNTSRGDAASGRVQPDS
ncbi:MAG TPA: hypothetical protein VMP01_01510 [Pirellulaceae bacterium]|nr:hypothetical protein [Pirellulaceae bacterium]